MPAPAPAPAPSSTPSSAPTPPQQPHKRDACKPLLHPYTSRYIHAKCFNCARQAARERSERQVEEEKKRERLEAVVRNGWVKDVSVEEWKWKVRLGVRAKHETAPGIVRFRLETMCGDGVV